MGGSPVELSALRPERVCLIKPSSLGDIVHALPVLSALRERWPEAHIAWVVNRGLRGLLDGQAELDEVIPFDRGRSGLGPSGLAYLGGFLRELRRHQFDLVVDLQGLLRSGLMAAATGAPIRVGPGDAREGAGRFYTHRVPVPTPRNEHHAVDRYLCLASALGADTTRPRFVVACGAADRDWARAALAGVGRPRLVLNLGARWQTKRWPPEKFAAVARRAAVERGAGLVAVGAPEDRPLIDASRAELGDVPLLDLCGRTTLPQLAAVAAECDAFLSNDTGPLHLAAAAGARVVGIYTCTRPEGTGPYGPRALTVQSRVWCAGSCVKTCARLECLDELDAARVWDAVRRQLDAAAGESAAA